MLGARDIRGVAPVKVGIGPCFLVQLVEDALAVDALFMYSYFDKFVGLGLGAVAPIDLIRLCESRLFLFIIYFLEVKALNV